jgi:phosphatidate cytidylyltransferase
MLNRILVAAGLLVVVALGFVMDSLRWLPVAGLAFLGVACVVELAAMVRPGGARLSRLVGGLIVLGLAWLGWRQRLDLAFIGVGVGASAALGLRAAISPLQGAWRDVSSTLGSAVYVGLPIAGLIQLLVIDGESRAWLLFLLTIVWMTDTCALFAGKSFGRTPIFPKLSPKKTWEGSLGGAAGALVAVLGARLFAPEVFANASDLELILACLVFSALTQIGDVAESMLKRDCEVKDSGRILGGHGGALDRLDSLLFVTMPFYAYLVLFQPAVLS